MEGINIGELIKQKYSCLWTCKNRISLLLIYSFFTLMCCTPLGYVLLPINPIICFYGYVLPCALLLYLIEQNLTSFRISQTVCENIIYRKLFSFNANVCLWLHIVVYLITVFQFLLMIVCIIPAFLQGVIQCFIP